MVVLKTTPKVKRACVRVYCQFFWWVFLKVLLFGHFVFYEFFLLPKANAFIKVNDVRVFWFSNNYVSKKS